MTVWGKLLVSNTKEEKESGCPMFSEYAEKWFETFKRDKLKPTTILAYRNDMKNWIVRYFGERRLNEITAFDVQAFYNSMQVLGRSSVHQKSVILRQILAAAKEDGFITDNPMDSKRLHLTGKAEIRREPLRVEEIKDIIKNLEKLQPKDMLLLAFYLFTGARRGEVVALKWKDIDFDTKLIHISRSCTYVCNRPVFGPPKSRSGVRFVPLLPPLEKILLALPKATGFIIEELFTERKFKRTWERIGKTIEIYGATPHRIRHTYITTAVTRTDIKTLQTIAGHADISTTINRYSHSREERIKEAGEAFGNLYL